MLEKNNYTQLVRVYYNDVKNEFNDLSRDGFFQGSDKLPKNSSLITKLQFIIEHGKNNIQTYARSRLGMLICDNKIEEQEPEKGIALLLAAAKDYNFPYEDRVRMSDSIRMAALTTTHEKAIDYLIEACNLKFETAENYLSDMLLQNNSILHKKQWSMIYYNFILQCLTQKNREQFGHILWHIFHCANPKFSYDIIPYVVKILKNAMCFEGWLESDTEDLRGTMKMQHEAQNAAVIEINRELCLLEILSNSISNKP